jgi:hypothetical protein
MKRFNALTTSSTTVPKDSATTKRRRTIDATPAAAPEFRRAAILLHAYTKHSGDFWRLAGPDNVEKRVEIMSALLGKRVAKKAAGLTAIRDLFYSHIGANAWTVTSQADKDAKFSVWLSDFCDGKAPETNVPTPSAPIPRTSAPASMPIKATVRYDNALARTAASLPIATVSFLMSRVDGMKPLESPEDVRMQFAQWCDAAERDAEFSDWRRAWESFAAQLVAEPASPALPPPTLEPLPFSPPVDIIADALTAFA